MAETEQDVNGTAQRNGRASIADLTKRVSQDASNLVRAEIELAKTEVSERAAKLAVGAGMLAAAALFMVCAVAALVATAILALATTMDAWLAALIVALVLLAVAGLVALIGSRRLRSGGPPVPTETVQQMKEDVQWVKQHATSGEKT